ncbi:hypothetical protein B0H21DRAFT_696509 [Amylocystis lapponica]|nr:hypothetical protein B0H21DRAFT_696509 [Amylocystis lapponica]
MFRSVSVHLPWVTQGRIVRRVISMFEPVENLIAESDRRRVLAHNDQAGSEPVESNDDISLQDSDRMLRGYAELVKWLPDVVKRLDAAEPEEMVTIYQHMRIGSDRARGSDAHQLKLNIVPWLSDLFDNPIEPRLHPDLKTDRGLKNDATARLLVPAIWDWDDPNIRAQIKNGAPEYAITADYWPAFVYQDFTCNLNDLDEGLFRSKLLVKAFKHIFTSPSSAFRDTADENVQDSEPPARKQKYHRSATRASVHFALSDIPSWADYLDCYDYVMLYNNVVDYFEAPPGPIARQHVFLLLEWWHRYVDETSNLAKVCIDHLTDMSFRIIYLAQGHLSDM